MSTSLMLSITVFGGLAFTLVTLVLYTMAHQLESAIERHELIRSARMRQQAYLRSLAERRRGANADYGVDIVDNDSDTGGDLADDNGFNVDIVEDEMPLQKAA
ncbi:MAG: hypothetical protein AAGH99_01940 [Planctomycetota bacterium]